MWITAKRVGKNLAIFVVMLLFTGSVISFYASITSVIASEPDINEGILVEGFENADEWVVISGQGASKSADTTHYQEGTQGLKMHVENGTTGVFNKVGTFNFSAGSNIFFYLYVDNVSKFSGLDIYLADANFSKYKHYLVYGMGIPGWNRILINKGNFETVGGASWDDIFTNMRLRCVPVGGETINVTIDSLRTDYQAQPVCIITFDDGEPGVYDKVFPILDANNQQAVAFVITDAVGKPGHMTKAQLDTLQDAGWDISNHSKSHQYLDTLNAEELEHEVNDAYQWLVDNGFENGARFFAYPGGRFNDAAISKVTEKHELARCSLKARFQPHLSGLGDENYLISMRHIQNDVSVETAESYIDDVINQKGLLVLLFHDIVDDNAGEYEYLARDFEEISDYLKTKENVLSVMTFSTYIDWLAKAEPDTTPPYTSGHAPAKDATGVPISTNIVVHIQDDGDGVDDSTIAMAVDGSPVIPVITGTADDYTLTYDPPSDFGYLQIVNVTVHASDLAGNPMTTDAYSFTTTETTTITSINPDFGYQGQTLAVTITGNNLGGAIAVSFDDITIDGFTVNNNAKILADISILADAVLGTRDVSVSTSDGISTLIDGFMVIIKPEPPISNRPPTAPVVDVTPDSPTTSDNLVCNITTPSTDPDSDSITYSYAWYKDTVLQGSLTTNTVASSYTSKGEVWRCFVTPNDGTVNGSTNDDQVTIGNSPPVLSGAAVSPASGDSSTAYTYTITYTDVDNDSPVSIVIIIDSGLPQQMIVQDAADVDYSDGKVFTYTTSGLAVGSHTFQFAASDGIDDAIGDIGLPNGPLISAPPPSSGGSGGGGGGLEAPPGVKYVSDYVGTSGIFITDITADSEDGKAVLFIPKGTKGKTKQGEALWQITMFEMLSPLDELIDAGIIGLIYDFKPDGATFEPPITLTITYDQADVPAGVNEEDLVIAVCNDVGQWFMLEYSFVDPNANTITASVSHLSTFTVLTYTPTAASFTTNDLKISPAEVDIGESVTISVLVTNTGGQSGQYTVILKINDEVIATQYITLVGGSSQVVTFTDIPTDVAGSYTVNIDELSDTFTVKTAPIAIKPQTPSFVTSALTISPAEVKTGEQITISSRITNTSSATGTKTVTLKIDDIVVDTRDVTLAAGSSQVVTFTISKNVAGLYTVDVNGLSETFKVNTMINWWLIVGIIIALVVVIIGAVFALRKKGE